ncbi:eukaryotic porin/Tom40, partial [Baffinella frigidus]
MEADGTAGLKKPFWQKLLGSDNPNPGKFEDIGSDSRKIFMLDSFEGMRFEYQRGLSNSFGVSHILHLQPAQDNYGTYDFSANFSQGKHLLLSRTQTNGDVLARYILTATPNLTVQFQSQLTKAPHQSNAILTADYKGGDWFGQLKVGSFAQWGLSYLQSVTKNLAVGVDLTYLGRPPFNQMPMCISTVAARYSTERMVALAQLTSNARIQAAYVQRVKDNLTFGTEFTFDLGSRESTCAAGYEYSTPQGSFKTNLSSDGKVTSTFEKQLSEVSAVVLSAEVDHGKK